MQKINLAQIIKWMKNIQTQIEKNTFVITDITHIQHIDNCVTEC